VFRVPQTGQAVGQCAQALAIKLDDKALAGKIIKFDDSGLMASFENFCLHACCPNNSLLDHKLSPLLLLLRHAAASESLTLYAVNGLVAGLSVPEHRICIMRFQPLL
jgi:hypothetical protein